MCWRLCISFRLVCRWVECVDHDRKSVVKKCTKCKEEKEDTEFNRDRSNKDGLQSWCKVCGFVARKKVSKINQTKHLLDAVLPLTKVCSICKIEKSANEFSKATTSKDGLRSGCRECSNASRVKKTAESGISWSGKRRVFDEHYRIKSNNVGWVHNLTKYGRLDKPTKFICAMVGCTNQALEYHHLKYDNRSTEDPISVISPLCIDCHNLFHIRQREGIDLTDNILTQIELEYIRYKPPHIRFIKEKV